MNQLVTSVATGIFSAIVAAVLYDILRNRRDRKPLNSIINLGRNDSLIFVFPTRTDIPEVAEGGGNDTQLEVPILQSTSSEDFIAINNIKSALLKINWHGKDKLMQPNKLKEGDKHQFIFSIGSSVTNEFTYHVEKILIDMGKPIFRVNKRNHEIGRKIIDGQGTEYLSETFEQVSKYLLEDSVSGHKNHVPLSEREYVDFGYLTKVTNPFDRDRKTKIFIVAGIRWIGTWGVAECLKKNWPAIYKKLGRLDDVDFSAAIRIDYKNLDIEGTTVLNVQLI